MKYQFMQQHRSQFALAMLCRVLQVSRSGYYTWSQRALSSRAQQDQQLAQQVRTIHVQSRYTYGSPRVHAALQAQGIGCSQKRVARLMQALQLKARQARRYKATTDSSHGLPVASNLLARQFKVEQSNQVWAGDITYVWTGEGWLYLAVVLDLCSRRVVGWHMAPRLNTQLVVRALEMAWQQRRPAPGLLHHSDQGSQYASGSFQEVLAQRGLVCSMSRKGNCWDNAPVESFFATLKTELIHGQRFATRAAAMSAIFDYIEVFYNRQRRHSALGYVSPAEYEARQPLAMAA